MKSFRLILKTFRFILQSFRFIVKFVRFLMKYPVINTFPGLSGTSILPKTALIFTVPLRRTAPLKSSSIALLLDSIFWKTLSVPANTVTPNAISLLENVLLSTFPLLKLLFSNLFNLIVSRLDGP